MWNISFLCPVSTPLRCDGERGAHSSRQRCHFCHANVSSCLTKSQFARFFFCHKSLFLYICYDRFFFFNQRRQNLRWASAVGDKDQCGDNEKRLALLPKWASNKEIEKRDGQNGSDVINGVLKWESSGIYIVSSGGLAVVTGAQEVNYSNFCV